MVPSLNEFVLDLYLPLSKVRLDEYRSKVDPSSDLEMITNYFWDIDLAETMVPSLHAVELAVRNSIHTVLSNEHGTPMWFYKPGLLRSPQLEMLASALEKLSRKKHDATSDRIVGALMFGFWVSLLTGPYEQAIWQPDGFRLLHEAFPYARPISRKQIHTKLDKIRDLRNRVFHHQHIFDRSNLHQEHQEIHEVIQWISPTLHKAIHAVDNFPAVLSGRTQVQTELKRDLGIS